MPERSKTDPLYLTPQRVGFVPFQSDNTSDDDWRRRLELETVTVDLGLFSRQPQAAPGGARHSLAALPPAQLRRLSPPAGARAVPAASKQQGVASGMTERTTTNPLNFTTQRVGRVPFQSPSSEENEGAGACESTAHQASPVSGSGRGWANTRGDRYTTPLHTTILGAILGLLLS